METGHKKISPTEMRKDMLRMARNAGESGAHLGGSLSLAEIMAALLSGVLRFDPEDPYWPDRDCLILSKGHGSMAMYAAMRQAGLATCEDVASFKRAGHWMTVHPRLDISRRMECPGGSLGQGLSFAIGAALAAGRCTGRFFVILGDGECDEGQIWEAAMFAGHHKLKNVIAIVDANGAQYDGKTSEVLELESLSAKWRAFNWDVAEVDGHDLTEITRVLTEKAPVAGRERPLVIIARTVKGKGVSFMENVPAWHHASLTGKQFEKAIVGLEENNA